MKYTLYIANTIQCLLVVVLVSILITCELFIGIDGKRLDGFVNFDYIRDRIKSSYGLLAFKEQNNGFNWDNLTSTARHQVTHNMPARDLMKVLHDVLGRLEDGHVYFRLPDGNNLNGAIYEPSKFDGFNSVIYEPSQFEGMNSDFSVYATVGLGRARLRNHYLKNDTYGHSKKNIMIYGTIVKKKTIGSNKQRSNKQIGYLHIESFIDEEVSVSLTSIQDWARDIDDIIARLINTDGLILDIRQNRGGFPGNMLWIAGRFAKNKYHFMNTYMKNGPGRNDFAEAHRWYVEPQGTRQYLNPIVLITDGGTASNGEYFTLALRQFDHISHFGQNTMGIMGYIMTFEMPNGWGFTYSTGYSVGFTADNKEINYEQDGIPPETIMDTNEIKQTLRDAENENNNEKNIDPMLDSAITILLRKL